MRALAGLPPAHGYGIRLAWEGVGVVARTPHHADAVSGVLCLGELGVYTLKKVFHFKKLMRLGFCGAGDEGDQGTPGVPWRSLCWVGGASGQAGRIGIGHEALTGYQTRHQV